MKPKAYHELSYHGSDKDCCLHCGLFGADESEVCEEHLRKRLADIEYKRAARTLCERLLASLEGQEREIFEDILWSADI